MKKNSLSNFPSRNANSAKYFLATLGVLSTVGLMAQNGQPAETASSLSLFANPLFDVLLGVILLLIIIIAVLGGVLKNVAEVTKDKNKNTGGKIVSIVALIIFLSSGKIAFAQEAIVTSASSGYM